MSQKHVANGRVPRTPAHEQFLPGDLILSVNGEKIGDDLYRFDRIVDSRTGDAVDIEAVRNGRRFKARLAVRDAETAKVNRFVQFAGGVFQEQTPDIRLHGVVVHID